MGMPGKRDLDSDESPWPLKCPHCLHEFQEKVGRLKAHSEIRCPDCQTMLRYEPKEFLRALGQARRGLYDFSRTIVRNYPVPKLPH